MGHILISMVIIIIAVFLVFFTVSGIFRAVFSLVDLYLHVCTCIRVCVYVFSVLYRRL